MSRRLRLTPDDREAWATYLAANARAAEQYEALPTALRRWVMTRACRWCGVQTYAHDCVCRVCRAKERWAA